MTHPLNRWKRTLLFTAALAVCAAGITGCTKRQESPHGEFRVGDQVVVGPLTYTVVEVAWKNQLPAVPVARSARSSFLLLRMTVTNGGGQAVSLPLMEVESPAGDRYRESEDGAGIDGWMGLLRRISPAQTLDGWMAFDVPRNSYNLVLTDGSLEGEKRSFVNIPLRVNE